MRWPQRLKRVFGIDVKTCTAFGGTMHIIACIEDPVVIKRSSRTKRAQSRRRILYQGLDWRKVGNPVYISYNLFTAAAANAESVIEKDVAEHRAMNSQFCNALHEQARDTGRHETSHTLQRLAGSPGGLRLAGGRARRPLLPIRADRPTLDGNLHRRAVGYSWSA